MDKVFYVPGQPWVLDFAVEREDGVLVSEQEGKTLAEIQHRSPSAILVTYKQAVEKIEAGCKSNPRPIDAADFLYAQNELPLEQWVVGFEYESFKLGDRINGRIAAIYARIGNTYWKFEDVYSLSHIQIITRVKVAQQAIQPAMG